MKPEKQRYVVERLGGEWHFGVKYNEGEHFGSYAPIGYWTCACGRNDCGKENINLLTPDGFFWLIENDGIPDHVKLKLLGYVLTDSLEDVPKRFANAVFSWLKEK